MSTNPFWNLVQMSETDFLSIDQIIFQIIIFPSYNLNDKKTQIDPIILYRNCCTNFISLLSHLVLLIARTLLSIVKFRWYIRYNSYTRRKIMKEDAVVILNSWFWYKDIQIWVIFDDSRDGLVKLLQLCIMLNFLVQKSN